MKIHLKEQGREDETIHLVTPGRQVPPHRSGGRTVLKILKTLRLGDA